MVQLCSFGRCSGTCTHACAGRLPPDAGAAGCNEGPQGRAKPAPLWWHLPGRGYRAFASANSATRAPTMQEAHARRGAHWTFDAVSAALPHLARCGARNHAGTRMHELALTLAAHSWRTGGVRRLRSVCQGGAVLRRPHVRPRDRRPSAGGRAARGTPQAGSAGKA